MIKILPIEMNAFSILAGLKRDSELAISSFERLVTKGWLKSVYAKRIARGLVYSSYEEHLTKDEIDEVHSLINWSERNRSYWNRRNKRKR